MADDQPIERWLPIPGWEGSYEVSDHGRVRSLDRIVPTSHRRTRMARGRILKPGYVRGVHQFVNLSRKRGDGKATSRYVHQLVLEAFVGPCPSGMEVCHWNDDGTDNRLSNLRYASVSENRYDLVRNGKHHNANKSHCIRGHALTGENVYSPPSGGRQCWTCKRDAKRKRRAERRHMGMSVD